jgi:hypothetical protein
VSADQGQPFIDIRARFSQEEALALAQLVKRITFSDVRQNAVDESEAYVMLDALNEVQKALREAGYDPR